MPQYRLIFVAVFVVAAMAVLYLAFGAGGSAMPNYDEGMYILQARAIEAGQIACQDFFCHQPPAYIRLLAAAGATGNLATARTAGTVLTLLLLGVAIAIRSRRRLHLVLGLVAFVPLLLHPQARYYLLAMPNALAVAAALAGFTILAHRQLPVVHLAGILLLGAAGALKFLAVPLILVAIVYYLGSQRHRLSTALVTGGTGVIVTLTLAHSTTQGAIWGVITDQLARTLQPEVGVQLWADMQAGWQTAQPDAGVWTNLQWQRVWQSSAAGLLAATMALVPVTVLRTRLRREPYILGLYGALAGATAMLLAVVAPVWNHYFVLFPLLASMLWFEGLLQIHVLYGNRATIASAVLAILASIALFQAPTIPQKWINYTQDLQHASAEMATSIPLLSFSPLLNILSGHPAPCRLVDPMNTYGGTSLAARYRPELAITESALIACLQTYPQVLVWAGYEYQMLVSDQMDARLRQLPNLLWFDY